MKRLRIAKILVQPVLVFDDDETEELIDGPPVETISVPLSQLAQLTDVIQNRVIELQGELDAQAAAAEPEGEEDPTPINRAARRKRKPPVKR